MVIHLLAWSSFFGVFVEWYFNETYVWHTTHRALHTHLILLRGAFSGICLLSVLAIFQSTYTCGIGLVCWWGNLSVKNREKLNRIYTISCKIAMCCTPDTSLKQLYKSRTLQMATKILSDPTHFLHECYELLPSGRSYRMPTVKTQRALKSFIPSSIKYMNQPHTK